jgi:hypothetical protein
MRGVWLHMLAACFVLSLVAGVVVLVRYDQAHPCVRSERRLVPGSTMFVQSGNVLIPIVQPSYYANVCVERAAR